jgi:hypothetical protein
VAYDVEVRLDTKQHLLHGQERLWYWNNSPDTLSFVWVHLYPNAYRDRSTVFGQELEQMQQYGFSFAAPKDRGYIDVQRVAAGGVEAGHEVQETEMKVNLPRALAPGDSVLLEFEFVVRIPAFFSRLGHKGKHYVVSQWYPKMVVYDAVGWHPDQYRMGEFYGEFGTFDVHITLPEKYVVAATGMPVASAMRKTLALPLVGKAKKAIGSHAGGRSGVPKWSARPRSPTIARYAPAPNTARSTCGSPSLRHETLKSCGYGGNLKLPG